MEVGPERKVEGWYNDNPALTFISYDVEFPTRKIGEHTANVIAENLMSRMDVEVLFKAMVNYFADFEKDHVAICIKIDGCILEMVEDSSTSLQRDGKLKVIWNDNATN